MRRLYFILALLCSHTVFASGLVAPFTGSRLSGLTRSSTIVEYDSTVDGSGNLVDKSGSNYLTYSDNFNSWTKTRSTVTINSYRNPLNNTKNADTLVEDNTAGNTHYVYNTYSTTSGVKYTFSVYAKKSARTWIRLNINTDAASAYFNLDSGTTGTTASNTTARFTKVTDGWYRCSISWTSGSTSSQQFQVYIAEADNDITFDGVLGQNALIVFGGQLNIVDEWRDAVSIYKATTATTKPLHDLAPTGSPTGSKSTLQGSDGRLLNARTFNGVDQRYSKAHHDSFNLFDSDFTMTMIFTPTSDTVIANRSIFAHYNAYQGIYINVDANKRPSVDFYKGPGSGDYIRAYNDVIMVGYTDNVIQLVRRSGVAVLYVNGTSGTPANVAGYGVDVSTPMYIMYSPSVGYEGGSILYTRIDTEALSDIQLARDRETLQGTLMSSGNLAPGSTFYRSTTASMKFSDGTVGYVAANVPRVTGDGGGTLIEESRTNSVLQSQTFDTTWTKRAGDSISVNGAVAPDGTTTADGIIGEAVDESHYFTQNVTTTAVSWTISVFAKAGNKDWAVLSDTAVANGATYFNVSKCKVGTVGSGTTSSKAEPYANNWCRISMMLTATAASNQFVIYAAEADTDNSFAGDGATVNTWLWGAQVEAGSYPTSYVVTTAASSTRGSDNLTLEPWRISKNTVVSNPMFGMYFDNDVYAASTYASEIGNYSFTTNGDTKRIESQTLNDYFSFDGSGDYMTLPNASGGSDFNLSSYGPNTNFSIVAIITPSVVSGSQYILTKTGTDRSWALFLSDQTARMGVSVAGSSFETTALTGNVLTANKTVLITAAYEYVTNGTSKMRVYVNAEAAGTSDIAGGPVFSSSAAVSIAGSAAGTLLFSGKIHYLAFYKGTVITQAQHNAMYASFKEDSVLPITISATSPAKKLYVEFDYIARFSGTSDIGGSAGIVFSIGGNTGIASGTRNYANISTTTDGRSYMYLFSNEIITTRYIRSGAFATHNQWHTYKATWDFSDLARSTFLIDGVPQTGYSSMTGSDQSLVLTDSLIRFNQRGDGTNFTSGRIRNLKVRAIP